MHGYRLEVIAHTVVNTLAILSGMVCDGAKPSCAAKIAMAVEAGLLGYEMYLNGKISSWMGKALLKKAWITPLLPWAVWHAWECGKPTGKSWI